MNDINQSITKAVDNEVTESTVDDNAGDSTITTGDNKVDAPTVLDIANEDSAELYTSDAKVSDVGIVDVDPRNLDITSVPIVKNNVIKYTPRYATL